MEVSENQLALDFSSLYQSDTHGKINMESNGSWVHYLCIFYDQCNGGAPVYNQDSGPTLPLQRSGS